MNENSQDVVIHTQKNPVDEDHEHDTRLWKSCCLSCDREVTLYLTKTFFSLSVLVFAMYSIASNKDPCKDLSFPTGLICTVLGSYIEQSHQMVKGRSSSYNK